MGRKKSNEPRFDIRLRMEPQLHERIVEAAKEDATSVAGFIRSVVLKELKRREKRT